MNTTILQQYGLNMRKSSKPYFGSITGFLAPYLSLFRHPDDVQDMIDDVTLAINGQFSEIIDPDYGSSLAGEIATYWHARITPEYFEIYHNSQREADKMEIPLHDWREILISWKECLEI